MRDTKKKPIGLVLLVALLAIVAAGLIFVVVRYHVVDFKLYPKDSTVLDLTGETVSLEHYDNLKRAMPDCEIRWNVPFQDGTVAHDATEVTVTTLTEADIPALTYLQDLEVIHAGECRDYDNLMYLKQVLPDVKVEYQVCIGGRWFDQDTTQVKVDRATKEELLTIQYLPKVTGAVACGGESGEDLSLLRNYCLNTGLDFAVEVGGQVVPYETSELTVEGLKETEVHLLQYLKKLESLHLIAPEATPEQLLSLREQHSKASVTWEVEIGGQMYPDTTTEVDLSQVVVEDLAEVERAMAYFPDAETLILGLCGIDNPEWGNSKMDGKLAVSAIDNEEIAAFRDRVQDQYKVVWTVRLGPSIALRTDADNFMPNHFGVGRLPDDYAHNLRYCIDMVCLDLGHMTITHIDFVQYMPKLKYLILAWTNVQYIEPIRNCKELIFLELDNSAIRDIAPLADCPKLEDLNIGNAWPKVDGILEMTWLKNVYMIFGSGRDAYRIAQALPDTRVVTRGTATVGAGWRRMQNYYDMRDMLHAPYMN